MDANIKVAAGCLRKAISNMHARVQAIYQSEYQEKQRESQEESRVVKDLHQDELTIAINVTRKDKNQDEVAREDMKLVARDYGLRKHRNEVKNELDQKVSGQEKEIRSLQEQIKMLNELARTLENWHG